MNGIDPELAAWGMQNNPEFAKYMQQQQGVVQGQQLAKAYSGVEDFLRQKEQGRRDDYTRERMASKGDAPIPMRNPNQIADVPYQAPTSLEQWKERNSAMMASGNPFLQERAAKQMDKGFTSPTTTDKVSNSAQIALDLGYKKGTKAFNDFVLNHSKKQKMFEEKRISVNDAKGLRYKDEFGGGRVEPYSLQSDLAGKVMSVTSAQAKDETQKVKTGLITDEMEDMLFGSKGIYSERSGSIADRVIGGIEANVQQFAQTDPRFKNYNEYAMGSLSPLVKSLGEVGALAEGDIERAMTLIPKITGINPDSKKVAREKLDKLRRLAQLDASGEATKEKVNAILSKTGGSEIPDPKRQNAPVGSSWREKNFAYRVRPDGSIQKGRIK